MTQTKKEELSTHNKKQGDKFRAMANDIEASGDELSFDAALKKLAKPQKQGSKSK